MLLFAYFSELVTAVQKITGGVAKIVANVKTKENEVTVNMIPDTAIAAKFLSWSPKVSLEYRHVRSYVRALDLHVRINLVV